MTIEIIGAENRHMDRVKTGIWSFDVASASGGNLGHPVYTIIEIYGYWGVGKSSFSYFLSGKFAKDGNIQLMDLEGFDRDYVLSSLKQSNYKGTLRIVPHVSSKGKLRSHSEMATDFLNYFLENEDYRVGIFDSVGAFIPDMELAGEIGDSNMGRRAIAVNQIMRKGLSIIQSRDKPLTFIVTNHVTSVMGGKGHDTPGGNAVKFTAASRIYLQNKRVLELGDIKAAYVVGGRFEKMRFGGKGKSFQFVLIPNKGVSLELSALFDCIELGLAVEDRVIKMDNVKYGYLSKLVEYAVESKTEKFQPFFEKLENYYEKIMLGINKVEETSDDEKPKPEPEILDE